MRRCHIYVSPRQFSIHNGEPVYKYFHFYHKLTIMHPRYLLCIALPTLLASCAVDDFSTIGLGLSSDLTEASTPASKSNAPNPSGPLTRKQAVGYAISSSPRLQSRLAEIRALQAEIVQAGLPPNPELAFEIENFGGSGSTKGFDSAEVTTGLSQRLETAGKRSKRSQVSSFRAEAVIAEVAAEKLEVAIAADQSFTDLLEAQSLQEIAQRNLNRAEENLRIISELLAAGKGTRVDVNRAKLAISSARGRVAEMRRAEARAAADLSRTWGGVSSNISARGELRASSGGLSTNTDATIANHPTMRAAELKISHAEATYSLEKARRISDVSVDAGVRQMRDVDETSAVVGLSVPLPLFNQNQGNIRAAKERVSSAQQDKRRVNSQLRTRITSLNADLRAAREQVAEFDSRTQAAARQTLTDVTEAYSSGKSSLLHVLDARETLFNIEQERIRALADLARAQNTLKILTRP